MLFFCSKKNKLILAGGSRNKGGWRDAYIVFANVNDSSVWQRESLLLSWEKENIQMNGGIMSECCKDLSER